jgi:hypothetical protein
MRKGSVRLLLVALAATVALVLGIGAAADVGSGSGPITGSRCELLLM